MNTFVTFTALLLVGLASTAPVNDDILHIDNELFPELFVIYTGENDITNLVVPVNSLNFEDEPDDEEAFASATAGIYIFFVEENKGLFVLQNKTATKLLENGNDISAASDDNKAVFFGASDGIYTFNAEKKTAEKYGTLTDNIINIAVANATNEIFILTADHIVYKVTEDGTNKEEVTEVEDAQQIVLDSSNNLYFVNSKKQVHVRLYEDGTVKKIKDLPAHPSSVKLLRPPIVIDDSVPVISGKKAFLAYSNGTAEFAEIILDTKPTAYSVEPSLLVYAAHDKKIYECNILNIVVLGLLQEGLEELSEVKSHFSGQTSEIQNMATKSMKTIRAN
ncbi:hypothetical protein ABMA28_010468 [Loxostege sticticalis]|uniref:Uncharacterized protein n=1 Tax=Loxostege sticticalis TaxID=481309 RepID=A0ABD0S8B5_LOXSC